MEPTHLHRQVENATAPSAGGSSDPDGKVWMGKRIPFRTTSCQGCLPLQTRPRRTWLHPGKKKTRPIFIGRADRRAVD
ncbi:MAG: hypothetical protein ACOX52_13755 [Verrucomicrobiota bacterium]